MPGRIQKIEDIVAGTLAPHNNLKIIVRGSPDFIDQQLDGGDLRFSSRRGSLFTAMLADNQAYLAQDAYKDASEIYVVTRPGWIAPRSLIRIGESESLGELHIVSDLIQPNGIEITDTLLLTYSASTDQQRLPVVSLVGTPCTVFAPTAGDPSITMLVESWYQIVPQDVLLMSLAPDILPSFAEHSVKRANLIDTATEAPDSPLFDFLSSVVNISADSINYPSHGLINGQMVSFTSDGNLPSGLTPNVIYYVRNTTLNTFQLSTSNTGPLIDLTTTGYGTNTLYIGRNVYRYEIELFTETGHLPFVPPVGNVLYLKAHPLYLRGDFNVSGGSIQLDNDLGPFLIDAFHGAMLDGYSTTVFLGLKTFDGFGNQTNLDQTGGPVSHDPYTGAAVGYQQWQVIESGNYLLLERPIISQSLLFWQRITGNFQYQQAGFFQAELDANGEFTMSSDLLVPPWPTDKERGWVIPLMARVETRVVIQFEPQDQQVFTIPGNVLSYIRPKIRQHQPIVSLVPSNITVATSTFFIPNYGMLENDNVTIETTGTLPGGLSSSTTYYVVNTTSTTFQLSLGSGGPPVNVTSQGVGSHTIKNTTSTSIRRIMLSFKSSPNSRVEIRDWEFDGATIGSLTYFILGVGETWGVERWMAGGFSIKPMFFNMKSLTANYSDGISKYNAGYIYA